MHNLSRLLVAASIVALPGCESKTPFNGSDSHSSATENDTPDDAKGKLWVKSKYADRFTCDSEKCGIVGRYMFREAVFNFERKGSWIRATKYYEASCKNGHSEYVDKGPSACVATNGIRDGKFAEWVEVANVTSVRPSDPADTASDAEKLIAQSDDFAQHRKAFVTATNKLISDGRCTAAEIAEMGGWAKSSNNRTARFISLIAGDDRSEPALPQCKYRRDL